ncbi:MAG: hypothetical protein D3919_15995, partial [Candidatus Electrothrix sp. AW5]|nr:hypothetical protein [Candidatus Electrothrix gigas]
GKVGIGTTNPEHRLDVVGTAKISGGVQPDYDSGWYHEDSMTGHVVTKTHNLGVYPSRIQILFSEDNPPSGYIIPVPLMTNAHTGGPESLKFDSTELVYSIYSGDFIAYWWDNAGTAKSYRSGYYRVLLWK